MLREKASSTRIMHSELMALDPPKLQQQYNIVLLQAHIIDEAIQSLKDDGSHLVKSIGALAFVWARWNLEAEDKFRQNEVLLIMSTLIYNTITLLERHRNTKALSEAQLTAFFPPCEYFMMLLIAVEWPNTWKNPLHTRLGSLFPQLEQSRWSRAPKDDAVVQRLLKFHADSHEARKETIIQHPLTQGLERFENCKHPEPGNEFFERHRNLYSWLMSSDEAISASYVLSVTPNLRDLGPQ